MDPVLSVECADIVEFSCDVIVLKFAQALYGADLEVAHYLRDRSKQSFGISPAPGEFLVLPTSGRVAAKQVVYAGVVPLTEFGYGPIRSFAYESLAYLARIAPTTTHIGMTMHGVGYGLDERESFLAQLAGLLDAIQDGSMPPALQRVTIVEQNPRRANRLSRILEERAIPTSSGRQRTINAGVQSSSKPHVFVAMPFSEDMEDVYEFGIQAPVNAAGFLCERVDMNTFFGDILAHIKTRIQTASLVVADLTGANPNVYLEVGYAWGQGRPTLLLARKDEHLRFDVQSQRCILYKNISDLAKRLAADLAALREPQRPTG